MIKKRWDNVDPITYVHYTNLERLDSIRYLREEELARPVVPTPVEERSMVQSTNFAIRSTVPTLTVEPLDTCIFPLAERINARPDFAVCSASLKPIARPLETRILPLAADMSEPYDCSIPSLASRLDNDSIDLIVKAFK